MAMTLIRYAVRLSNLNIRGYTEMASNRLTQKELHSLFLQDVGANAEDIIDNGKKPLYLRLSYPFNRELKVYREFS